MGKCKRSVVFGSYKKHLLENTNFRKYCEAGIFTQQQNCILHFLRTTDLLEEIKINVACQQMMTDLLLLFHKAATTADRNIESSFWVNVFQYIGSQLFSNILTLLRNSISNRKFTTTILFSLIRHFEIVMEKCFI